MLYDIVIAGAGPAGLTAALYARRAGHSVLVLEGGVPGGQAVTTPHVENWPGTLSISGPDFAMGLYQQCTELGAEIQFAAVTGFEDRGDRKTVRAGEQIFEGRTFILANGVRRRKLEVPGEERLGGRGVSYCATCDGSFFKGKDVAVVGGGNTAVEDAIYLSSICPTVWLIHRRDSFTAQQYLLDNLASKPNVKPLMGHRVLEIQGDKQVESLRLSGPENQRILHVAGVFAAVGLIPDNAMFSPPLELNEYGYVKAGEDCATNVPGVFVAGDSRSKELRQLVTAAADGAMAASKAGQYLGIAAVGDHILLCQPQRGGNFGNGLHFGFLCDLDIRLHQRFLLKQKGQLCAAIAQGCPDGRHKVPGISCTVVLHNVPSAGKTVFLYSR